MKNLSYTATSKPKHHYFMKESNISV